MIERVIRAVNVALLSVASAGVLLLAVTVFGGVLWRYVLGSPLNFVLPISEYMLFAVVFLAMSGTLLKGGHVRIDFITDAMPKRASLVVRQLGDTIGVATVGVLCWLSLEHYTRVLASQETDISVLRVPLWMTQWLMIVGFTMMVITYVLLWVRNWRSEGDATDSPAHVEKNL